MYDLLIINILLYLFIWLFYISKHFLSKQFIRSFTPPPPPILSFFSFSFSSVSPSVSSLYLLPLFWSNIFFFSILFILLLFFYLWRFYLQVHPAWNWPCLSQALLLHPSLFFPHHLVSTKQQSTSSFHCHHLCHFNRSHPLPFCVLVCQLIN